MIVLVYSKRFSQIYQNHCSRINCIKATVNYQVNIIVPTMLSTTTLPNTQASHLQAYDKGVSNYYLYLLYNGLICCSGMCSEKKQLETLQLLVQLMPREHYLLLECILELLHKVLAEEESNKMTATALGMLFAPGILAPRNMLAKDLHEVSPNISNVVAFMVENALEVFKVKERPLKQQITKIDEM